jgi:hypothetical protein
MNDEERMDVTVEANGRLATYICVLKFRGHLGTQRSQIGDPT